MFMYNVYVYVCTCIVVDNVFLRYFLIKLIYITNNIVFFFIAMYCVVSHSIVSFM